MRPFDEENRLTQDDCALMTRSLVNKSISDYMFFNNYFTAECKEEKQDKMQEFMTNNPNLRFKDGYGFTTPCVVDMDSEMRNNSKLTNPRERVSLCSRWYTAVPNLGRGGLVPNIESKLKYSGDTSAIKDCDRLTEKDFDRFIPLPSCMADNIQNPNNIIEKWTRGGDFTRDYIRSDSYLEQCGFYNDGKMWRRRGNEANI
uniref:Uncharacterized protein n=1 Tax=viral metagenome TaxID=1070528 RepID=A0A6C0BFK4_9ZZZZ